MLYQLLNIMYHLNIEIKEINNKTKLVYEKGILNEELKEQIKAYKGLLLQRLDENEKAQKLGFIVYHHGELYEYRYGLGAFLYVERLQDGKVTAWRENFLPNQQHAYKTKLIVQNVSFVKAFDQAEGFINWMNKNRGKKRVG
jgi:hypothetical protein